MADDVRLSTEEDRAGSIEVFRIEDVAQVAQSFAGKVVRFEIVRGDERVYLTIYIESAAIGGYVEGVEYRAEFAVRTLRTSDGREN